MNALGAKSSEKTWERFERLISSKKTEQQAVKSIDKAGKARQNGEIIGGE